MAVEWYTSIQLGIVGTASVWCAILLPTSTPDLIVEDWVFGATATVMLLIAATLSAIQHRLRT